MNRDNTAVYLSAIGIALGERTPLDQVAAEDLDGQRETLLAEGLRHVLVSDRAVPDLAAESALRTLAESTVPVDSVVYCTDTRPDVTATADLRTFFRGIERVDLPGTVVGGADCGNFGLGLAAARQTLLAGQADAVLLVTADRVLGGQRYLANGVTVLSDGAASCVVSRRRPERGPALRVLSAGTTVQRDVADSDRPLTVARATSRAISRIVRASLEPLSLTAKDVRHLVTGHYGDSPRSFLAMAAGVSPELAHGPRRAEVGHCFAADVLLGAAGLLDGAAEPGDLVLLLASGPDTWSAVVAECVPEEFSSE